ncbi:unnamed protein product [Caenorhabditis bovis]|uniref:DOMON domain-containing protein n=1 Tax=Caenorhabditis bovis TaxID=2654633 RepID=A0A8S1FAY5_9PELO|nr:unnamed protein product [Caenorhabditis bovis]
MRLATLLFVLCYGAASVVALTDQVVGNFGFGNITLKWTSRMEYESVEFTVIFGEINQPSLVFIGFSSHGEMSNIDGFLCHNDYKRKYCVDVSIDENYHILRDISQDWHRSGTPFDFQSLNHNEITIIRDFVTCDPLDYAFESGTTQFIIAAAWNKNKIKSLNDKRWHIDRKFGKVIDFATDDQLDMDKVHDIMSLRPQLMAEEIVIKSDEYTLVPDIETHYQCIIKKMPIKTFTKYHIVKMEAYVEKGNEHLVHHMEVFLCRDRVREWSGDCNDPRKPPNSKSCSHVIGAWAMGEGSFEYPVDVGMPVGGRDTDFVYIMVEIHYNNPEKLFGYRDNSGMKFWITEDLRPYDAGIMELGQIYSDVSAIPPGQSEWSLVGVCPKECTASFPREGINIFASQLHAHLTGKRLYTSHYRNGVKLQEINRDNHYSPHWQHIQDVIPYVNVKPGDMLTTVCVYDSRNRTTTTFGGYGIRDEMCVNYVYYYPASEVEVCKSAVSNSTLRQYFRSRYGVSDKLMPVQEMFDRIGEWTKPKLLELHSLYHKGDLNIDCLRGDGSLLPFPQNAMTPISILANWKSLPMPTRVTGPILKERDRNECPSISDLNE